LRPSRLLVPQRLGPPSIGQEHSRQQLFRQSANTEKFKAELERKLERLPEVAEASVNLLIGNVLLRLSAPESRARVIGELEAMARPYVRAEPASSAKRGAGAQPKRSGGRGASPLRSYFAHPRPRIDSGRPASPAENWWMLDTRETLQRLEASRNGLAREEARHRLEIHGPNRLAEIKRRPPLRIFLEQLANPAMAMLGVSAVIAVATGGVVDAVVIVSAVLLNPFVGFVTESSSERTIGIARGFILYVAIN
jgi:Ca2+-transporting ATPase